MSNQTIGHNIQTLLKLHGDLTLSDLAKATGIPQPTLHHIAEGKTKKPRRQALEALATFFAVSIPQLTGTLPLSSNIPDSIKQSFKISTVPLIDWELAKYWKRDNHDCSQFREIILDKSMDENAFALQLHDASMEPLIQENSILIFDPTKSPKERDFVLVHLEKSNTMVCNRLFIDNKNLYLKQDKIDGDAILVKLNIPKDKIIATLTQIRLEL